DVKPSFPLPKVLFPGTNATVSVAIFSEKSGGLIWDAVKQVITNNLSQFPLTMTVGSVVNGVKVNNKGGGTCSALDVADPITGQKDGIKDNVCQFPTAGFPSGTNNAIIDGFFLVTPGDPNSEVRAFRAREVITIVR